MTIPLLLSLFGLSILFFFLSWGVRRNAQQSFSNYAIGNKKIPFIHLLFTDFATVMGAGNFIGHAGKGYMLGLPWLAFVLGEQGSKLVFALTYARFAGRFAYKTISEMIYDLVIRDRFTRVLGALLGIMIMTAWVAGQAKAFGEIFYIFSGFSPYWVVPIFCGIFVLYTVLGGIHSVIRTDLIQGLLVLSIGILFYVASFSHVDWSFEVLKKGVLARGNPEMWSFLSANPGGAVAKFVTAFFGILVAQVYWQRCFAAPNGRTAGQAMFIGGSLATIMVILTTLLGLMIFTINPNLGPDQAIPWFVMNYFTGGLALCVLMMVFAATISSADSCLNAGAIMFVNDVTSFRKSDDASLVWLTKWMTVVVGAVATILALSFETILDLFSTAYGAAGSSLAPLLMIGLFWKEKPSDRHEKGRRNSKVTTWGARSGLVVGLITSQIPQLGEYRNIYALLLSAVMILLVSSATRNS